MKKTLSFILLLVIGLSLCACGSKPQTETPASEVISVDTLFEDMTNGAKCALNVGKQVTVLGQIESITADSCQITLVSHPGKTVLLQMPTEKLAELSVENFVAVVGIVEAYSFGKYTISATEAMAPEEMDAVFGEIIADKFNYSKCDDAYDFEESLYLLYGYMSRRASVYMIQDMDELKEYLCGTWDCGSFLRYFPDSISSSVYRTFYITFGEDGSAEYSEYNNWRDDWELSDDGVLHSFFGERRMFIMSDNVFLCNGYVFVRQK